MIRFHYEQQPLQSNFISRIGHAVHNVEAGLLDGCQLKYLSIFQNQIYQRHIDLKCYHSMSLMSGLSSENY